MDLIKEHTTRAEKSCLVVRSIRGLENGLLKKAIIGLTPMRFRHRSEAMTELAPKLGGLVEFYRSPARKTWTPTGTNVPDYPKLAQLWWANIADAVSGEKSAQAAMDQLAEQQDAILGRLQSHGVQGECGPLLNEKKDPSFGFLNKALPKQSLRLRNPKARPFDTMN